MPIVAIACLTNVPLWFFLFLKTLKEKVRNLKQKNESKNTQDDMEKLDILKNKLMSDDAQANATVLNSLNN